MFLLVWLALSVPGTSLSSGPDTKAICSVCSCVAIEHILYISCDKGSSLYRPSELRPPAASLYHLNLQNNLLGTLYPQSFTNFSNAISLQLGNNKLQEIQTGAFQGLTHLKQLHLNNNELQVLRADMFLGLENLEYLQTDYNLIRVIERGTFNKMHRLKVLILNDNLISSLPDNIFRFASLTHLDLRGNRLQNIPYIGVLEHIGRIVQFQLEDNPWNCSCQLLALVSWLENMPYHLYIGEPACETPAQLNGKLLKDMTQRELCPEETDDPPDSSLPPPFQLNPRVTRRPQPAPRTPTSPPKRSQSGIVSGKFLSSNRNYSQIASFQTRAPALVQCPARCDCQSDSSDLALSVNCQERGIESVRDLLPTPGSASQLLLNGNHIREMESSEFRGYEGLDLLDLGNNRISAIHKGVLSNLTNLRRLFLNGNQIEKLCQDMFLGLHNLQYLYLEYNLIKEVLTGTFDSLANLQLLYLNNNLLKGLPAYAFSVVPLSRLNLRNNHFMYLPVSGVLDQLRSLSQIDLEGNPWDCTCDLVALKLWVEKLSRATTVKEVSCETPVEFAGLDLRDLKSEVLCPRLLSKGVAVSPSPRASVAPGAPPLNLSKTNAGGPVPLSILILSILVVLILTVFVAFCLLVFVLQRHKKGTAKHEAVASQECSSMQLHLKEGEQPAARGESTEPGTAGKFMPQTIEQLRKTYPGPEQGSPFADPQGQTIFLRNVGDRDKKRLSTIDELDELIPSRDPHLLYRNLVEGKQEINSIGFELQYPEKQGEGKKLKKSLLGASHSKMLMEQRKGECLELKNKFQGTPDYLQVLEEQTAMSQL
ncbi:SLIT and NTRK-like protein 4 [Stegostoma tigrinum]|uniref:SLIT and NTRK-like protein 4 n=1 Tax=Stegostoma tigrinum TaxID=3053191 RepID=UPI002870A73D|nr:SLIT and NTRK-like protein 4 [Stegostoma tigrinum]XP_048400527.2 SLIT and NTRK-like protein 4 [Stegostoma tigrinum]